MNFKLHMGSLILKLITVKYNMAAYYMLLHMMAATSPTNLYPIWLRMISQHIYGSGGLNTTPVHAPVSVV